MALDSRHTDNIPSYESVNLTCLLTAFALGTKIQSPCVFRAQKDDGYTFFIIVQNDEDPTSKKIIELSKEQAIAAKDLVIDGFMTDAPVTDNTKPFQHGGYTLHAQRICSPSNCE